MPQFYPRNIARSLLRILYRDTTTITTTTTVIVISVPRVVVQPVPVIHRISAMVCGVLFLSSIMHAPNVISAEVISSNKWYNIVGAYSLLVQFNLVL